MMLARLVIGDLINRRGVHSTPSFLGETQTL